MIKQGNSRFCFVCGLENPNGLHLHFYQPAAGEVEAEIRIPAAFQGWTGVVHGGIIAAMLDEAAGRAFLDGEQLDRFLFTAKLNIRYRKPVPVDQPLILRGRVKEEKGRVAIGQSEIASMDGTVLAEAEAIMAPIPPETLAAFDTNQDEWKIIPEEEVSQE